MGAIEGVSPHEVSPLWRDVYPADVKLPSWKDMKCRRWAQYAEARLSECEEAEQKLSRRSSVALGMLTCSFYSVYALTFSMD